MTRLPAMVLFAVGTGLIVSGLGISGMVALAYHADIITGSLWNDVQAFIKELI